MKLYIQAYDRHGAQILGNLDGQGVLRARNFRRTDQYKALATHPTLRNRVYEYRLVTEDDRLVEVVRNTTHAQLEAEQ